MSETAITPPSSPLDRFPQVTIDGATFHVDKRGWPIETCGRCGGSGRYSWCQMYGDTCFGCQGTGLVYATGNPGTIRSEYRSAVSAQRTRPGYSLAVGDEVRDYRAPKGTPFRRVVAVTPTDRVCSRSKSGDNPEIVSHFQQVTFDDGATITAGAEAHAGRVTIDRAPYIKRAQAAMATKLQRRDADGRRRAAGTAKPRTPKPITNRFAGQCTACGTEVPAGAGTWTRATGLRHPEGGCPQ